MPIRVITLGCRINAYESEIIKEFSLTENDFDITVINTCAVTSEAERQSRQTIRKLRKEHPNSFIIATGCAAQIHPKAFATMPEVDKVLGNKEKLDEKNFCKNAQKIVVGDISKYTDFSPHLISGFEGRCRGFLQIQQGCDYACTFCIVPKARGKNRSVPPSTIIKEAKNLVENGFKELVLTGINIASYGKDKKNREYGNIFSLARLILDEIPKLERLRFGSLDIGDFNDEIIDLFAKEERLMPHLHLSLQSGDDTVLKKMGRRHRRQNIINLCQNLRKVRSNFVFGADFITGFGDESDEMFSNTLKLIEECGISLLHVFPYSEREGTFGASIAKVSIPIRKERAKILRQKGKEELKKTLSSQVGKEVSVLLEDAKGGFSEHYLHVLVENGEKYIGEVVKVKITGHTDEALTGKVEL